VFVEKKTKIAVEFLRKKGVPHTGKGLSLEAGMAGFSNELGGLRVVRAGDVPRFPQPLAPKGREVLLWGYLDDQAVVVQEGRGYLYEGYFHREIAFPLRVFAALGVKRMILVASMEPLGERWEEGRFFVVEDHIDLTGGNSLRGALDGGGRRELDSSRIYSTELGERALALAEERGLSHGRGVMALLPGPAGPTPAERRMLRTLGADVLSLSLAPETMMALHLGVEITVLGLVGEKRASGSGKTGWGTDALNYVKDLFTEL
jgi:purine-nucleoside phosphorylase